MSFIFSDVLFDWQEESFWVLLNDKYINLNGISKKQEKEAGLIVDDQCWDEDVNKIKSNSKL